MSLPNTLWHTGANKQIKSQIYQIPIIENGLCNNKMFYHYTYIIIMKTNTKELGLSRIKSQLSYLIGIFKYFKLRCKLGAEITDNCPECHATPHDTVHLFECPSNPTHPAPSSLWTAPDLDAEFETRSWMKKEEFGDYSNKM